MSERGGENRISQLTDLARAKMRPQLVLSTGADVGAWITPLNMKQQQSGHTVKGQANMNMVVFIFYDALKFVLQEKGKEPRTQIRMICVVNRLFVKASVLTHVWPGLMLTCHSWQHCGVFDKVWSDLLAVSLK